VGGGSQRIGIDRTYSMHERTIKLWCSSNTQTGAMIYIKILSLSLSLSPYHLMMILCFQPSSHTALHNYISVQHCTYYRQADGDTCTHNPPLGYHQARLLACNDLAAIIDDRCKLIIHLTAS